MYIYLQELCACYYREYYNVLFTNLRVMIEGDNVIDGYFGPNGYRYTS